MDRAGVRPVLPLWGRAESDLELARTLGFEVGEVLRGPKRRFFHAKSKRPKNLLRGHIHLLKSLLAVTLDVTTVVDASKPSGNARATLDPSGWWMGLPGGPRVA